MTPALSVVIVARNEADRIRGCIESVLDLEGSVEVAEVVLVDSNSSDGTVDVASEYPITVLRIPSDELSSPGAGRHVGFRRVSGDAVLFVDGDMHLEPGWLPAALDAVARDDGVAGVDGLLDGESADGSRRVEYLRGVALYDADALAAVGGFDPGLQALEDVDVGYRLRRAGHELVRLPVVVASHPTATDLSERFRRWRRGYYLSNGQVLRKSLDDPRLLAKWLYRFRLPLSAGTWFALGVLLLATVRPGLLLAWGTASLVGFGAVASVRGVRWTATKLTVRLALFMLGVAIGFRRGPTPARFPMDRVETVQRRVAHHG